jgi:polyribonucleotide nucleotidyltransferase
MPNQDGLLHVSEIAHERVNNVSDYMKEGDEVEVKVIEVDKAGKIRLSRKVLLPLPEGFVPRESRGPGEGGGRGDRGPRGGDRGGRGGDRGPRPPRH